MYFYKTSFNILSDTIIAVLSGPNWDTLVDPVTP